MKLFPKYSYIYRTVHYMYSSMSYGIPKIKFFDNVSATVLYHTVKNHNFCNFKNALHPLSQTYF